MNRRLPASCSSFASYDDEMTRLVPRSAPVVTSRRPRPAAPAPRTTLPARSTARDTLPAAPARARQSSEPDAQSEVYYLAGDSIPPMVVAPLPAATENATTVVTPRLGGEKRRDRRVPTAVWGAGLIALGLFAGILTSVVVRESEGASAAFGATRVSPSAPVRAAAVSPVGVPVAVAPGLTALPVMPTPALPTTAGPVVPGPAKSITTPPAQTVTTVAPVVTATTGPASPAATAWQPAPTAQAQSVVDPAGPAAPVAAPPVPARRPTRAWVAPRTKTVTRKEAQDDARPAAVAAAPPPARRTAPKAKHRGDDEIANATAADELARAQLEAALR